MFLLAFFYKFALSYFDVESFKYWLSEFITCKKLDEFGYGDFAVVDFFVGEVFFEVVALFNEGQEKRDDGVFGNCKSKSIQIIRYFRKFDFAVVFGVPELE